MSISASVQNALTGLTAAGRAAEVISSNVANAMTPGYAKREINLASNTLGGSGAGVRVEGVVRALNQFTLTERRLADATAGNATLRSTFLAQAAELIGTPDQAGSLSGRLAAFESALLTAASRPDSTTRLDAVLVAASGLATGFAAISDGLQTARMEADAAIRLAVETLNVSLREVQDLNTDITAFRAMGRDPSALMDRRQVIVDRIAEIVPVREIPRDNGQIGLYATGGAILLDPLPATLGFSAAGIITPDMTLGSGALSGLTLNGVAQPTTDTGPLGGGRLGALFAIRDELAPGAQSEIDAVARDIAERFQSPTVDPTLAPGAAGLFTDLGNPFDPLNETGFSGRMAVNPLADPAQGGALWRIRDGLGATAPGPVGNAALLTSLAGALAVQRAPASGAEAGFVHSAAGLMAAALSGITGELRTAEDRLSFAAARQSALTEAMLADGVNTDAEMQMLLLVEQAFSANARVVQTMDQLLADLMRI
jgi:flagellar hook-associated protein 1 FlgK